jgi:GT2 family glycosyltransferase
VESRNLAVKTFLDEKETEWLFWLDTDMGFPADVIDRLIEAADPKDRPIVGALCFSQRELEPDGIGGWRCSATPTIFDWAHIKGQQGFAVRWEYPRESLVRCAGTGSACVLIHRSAFEAIEKEYGAIWYKRVPNSTTGQLISEDLSFCLRASALSIPIHVHTGVRTSHLKHVWLSETDYIRERTVEALRPAPELEPVEVAE